MVEDAILASLVAKLHPRRWPGVSSRFVALQAFVLGQHWTEPDVAWASVDSLGYITTETAWIGSFEDWERNMGEVAVLGKLTEDEVDLFWRLWRAKVDDWRPEAERRPYDDDDK